MSDFDMPSTGTWEERGGWVVRRLAADIALTLEQAAGLVGNLGYESRGFATLQEIQPMIAGSRGGYGWAQWTGPRRRIFEAWCAEHDLVPKSDEANYGFLVHELLGTYKSFAARLRQMASIEDACHHVHAWYERPQDALDGTFRSGQKRLEWARRALAGAQGAALAPSPTLPDESPASSHLSPDAALRRIQETMQAAGFYLVHKTTGQPLKVDSDFRGQSREALSDLLAAAGQPRL